MAITRQLVFDPATGHLVRDPDTGHLVRAALLFADRVGAQAKEGLASEVTPGWPPVWPDETGVMADAVADMQAASWASGGSALKTFRRTYKYYDEAGSHTQCQAGIRGYKYTCDDAAGESITGIILSIGTSTATIVPYRIKLVTSASSSYPTTWSTIYDSPQYQGSATGTRFFIPFACTLSDYLYMFIGADDYAAIPLSGAGSVSQTEPPLASGDFASSGGLQFVLDE